MGGLPWDVAARDLPVPEAISQRRAALGIPQATPRAQEAPPQAAKRGQGQACGDGQTAPDTQDQSTKRSKSVYNIISTQGWLPRPNSICRVAGKYCYFPAPSELDVRVAPHPAQAFTNAPCRTRSLLSVLLAHGSAD